MTRNFFVILVASSVIISDTKALVSSKVKSQCFFPLGSLNQGGRPCLTFHGSSPPLSPTTDTLVITPCRQPTARGVDRATQTDARSFTLALKNGVGGHLRWGRNLYICNTDVIVFFLDNLQNRFSKVCL